jgi:hypothetical protein
MQSNAINSKHLNYCALGGYDKKLFESLPYGWWELFVAELWPATSALEE